MSRTPTVECKPNGPYVVKDLDQLRNSSGEAIATQPVIALCRCGGSARKPFCDGTHRNNGFSSARQADAAADRLDRYAGARITIHDNRSICAHAGHCTDRLASVFKYGSEPWIDPDGASVEAIVEAIGKCPSGALSYAIEGSNPPRVPRDPAITVTKNGPYAVAGGVRLSDPAWAAGASTETYTLCRCGASRNKPFCDGSHWSAGFNDEGV